MTRLALCCASLLFNDSVRRTSDSIDILRHFAKPVGLDIIKIFVTSCESDLIDLSSSPLFDLVQFCPAKGVYNAYNHCIRASFQFDADWIWVLGAGDTLIFDNSSALRFFDLILGTEQPLCGAMLIGDRVSLPRVKFPKSRKWSNLDAMRINHPATIVPRHIYAQHGLYSENYRVVSDYQWMHFLFASRVSIRVFDSAIVYHELGGISSSPSKLRYREHLECLHVVYSVYGISFELFIATLLRCVRYGLSFLKSGRL